VKGPSVSPVQRTEFPTRGALGAPASLQPAARAWVTGTGILFRLSVVWPGRLRLSAADLVLIPLLVIWAFSRPTSYLRQLWRLSAVRWFLLWVSVVAVGGVVVSWFHLGSLSPEVFLKRPGVMLLMVISTLVLAAMQEDTSAVEVTIEWFIKSAGVLNVLALGGAFARYAFDIPNRMMFLGDSLRLQGLMLNPNTYGGFLAVALIVQAAALASGRPILRRGWLEAGNTIALLAGLMLTISRGAWIGAAAGLVIVLITVGTRLRSWNVRAVRLLTPALVVGLILLLFAGTELGGIRRSGGGPPDRQPLQSTLNLYRSQGGPVLGEFLRIARDPSGAADRWAITRVAFELYRESAWSVIFGIGGGTFLERSARTTLGFRTTIHNTFIWALVEHGILGIVTLLGFLAVLLRGLVVVIRGASHADFSSVAMVGALTCVLGIFLTHNAISERYVWFVVAVSLLRLRVAGAADG
jgi:hypothetical protein